MWPRSRTITRSARRSVEERWAMRTVVREPSSSASAPWMRSSVWASIADVASSSTRTRGLASAARALAARQREAALADDRLVTVGQLGDEVVGGGGPGRRLDLGVGGAGAA